MSSTTLSKSEPSPFRWTYQTISVSNAYFSQGALNRVPVIPQGEEVIVSALKRAGRIGPTKVIRQLHHKSLLYLLLTGLDGAGKGGVSQGMKNEAAKAKNMVAKQLDALTKELTVPLGKWIRGFPDPEHLHPFEKALLALSLGDD
eukprot:gene29475-36712_t